MQLRYGGYLHAANEATIVIDRNMIRTQGGVMTGWMESWTIEGMVGDSTDTQATLKTKIQNLQDAYSGGGFDLILYHNDGSTVSAHQLLNATTRRGVQVKSLKWKDTKSAEYTTYRQYSIVVEGEVVTSLGNLLVSFTERISFRGTGGPRLVVRELRNGPPVVQQVSQYSPVYATQSGGAVGLLSYPAIPSPIWPSLEDLPAREIAYQSPTLIGINGREFGTTWSYSFQSPGPLAGQPNTWY